jgi:hypothetical protein
MVTWFVVMRLPISRFGGHDAVERYLGEPSKAEQITGILHIIIQVTFLTIIWVSVIIHP